MQYVVQSSPIGNLCVAVGRCSWRPWSGNGILAFPTRCPEPLSSCSGAPIFVSVVTPGKVLRLREGTEIETSGGGANRQSRSRAETAVLLHHIRQAWRFSCVANKNLRGRTLFGIRAAVPGQCWRDRPAKKRSCVRTCKQSHSLV